MRLISLLVAAVFLATPAFAHQDTDLSVGPDGAILGLPPIYQETRLHIGFSDGDTGVLRELIFRSSGRETQIQPCLLNLVSKSSRGQLLLSGSWYHEGSMLPHYLNVQFLDSLSIQGLPHPPGVQFLFSLSDASLLQVEIAQVVNPKTVQFREVHLSDGCPSGESAGGSVTTIR